MKNFVLLCRIGGRILHWETGEIVKNRIFRSNAGLGPEVSGYENGRKADKNVKAKFHINWDSIDHASYKVLGAIGQNRNFRLIRNRNGKHPVTKMSG